MDEAISFILHSQQSARDVVLRVGPSLVTLLHSNGEEVWTACLLYRFRTKVKGDVNGLKNNGTTFH